MPLRARPAVYGTTRPLGKIFTSLVAELGGKPVARVAVDPYRENRSTGAFILIDESSNQTVVGGMAS